MNRKYREVAEKASFKAFLNSYIQEVKGEKFWHRKDWEACHGAAVSFPSEELLEVKLPKHRSCLLVEILYHSKVGTHEFGGLKLYYNKNCMEAEALEVIMLLCQEMHVLAGHCSHYDELLYRLLDSCQTMAKMVEHSLTRSPRPHPSQTSFIQAEQSLTFGHWMHPTPKSRQGMTVWQQEKYSPELSGVFHLDYFAVNRELIREGTAGEKPASQYVIEMEEEIGVLENERLVPMHPLQTQWLLQQEWVAEAMNEGLMRVAGKSRDTYSATSSLRTVFQEDSEWMLKFSIPVKVTNSLRVNKLSELEAGVIMASIFKKKRMAQRFDNFSIIHDPAYLTVQHKEKKESGFEVILRKNPFSGRRGVLPVAALVQEALPGERSAIFQLVHACKKKDQSIEEASLEWFKSYWNTMMIPLITLYEEEGIALEAHQQNCVVDVSSGFPVHGYYRDNQGYYLASSYKEYLLQLEPGIEASEELFYSETVIKDRFTYYLFLNNLSSVIHRLGADGLIQEKQLIRFVKQELSKLEQRFNGAGKRWIQHMLTTPSLACKANLLTRLQDVDELEAANEKAVYISIRNPFREEAAYEKMQNGSSGLQTAHRSAVV
ncbi:IucA/IucC family protein [Jeotgalibacillus sp. ET6]|uniref:IucA/IucC family protein n=1 Tax=Jeotgalibacillus sp. ET6 TaxID=3037260 RepID=UPI00241853EE|nr:IucA/IucC family protein [Jeotgalibacillus sp. ET6]MDG5472157.1 IucA/IucC family protein [Jeotgalibacillus sp. ET6]